MKLVLINDTHCGIRNSSDIFIEYQRKFYSEVLFPYMDQHNIKQIVHLGDYYDNRKTVNLKALNANREMFLSVLRDKGIRMDIICGNHDTYYRNTNDLNSLKELLGHYMDEVTIIHEPTVVNYDGLNVALVPWINPENEAATIEFLKTCNASHVGAHLELEGFEMQAGIPCTHGMKPDIFNRFEMVLSGHFHTKSQQGPIHYLGSQMEFFWSDAHDPKYFHVLDTDTRELTPVRNTVALFERIYYDDTVDKAAYKYKAGKLPDLDDKFVKVVVVNKSDPKLFEHFVDRIQSHKIHELKIAENFEQFVGSSIEDDKVSVESTEDLLYSYIDAVETSLDKDRIKSMVHHLMVEAQTMELV